MLLPEARPLHSLEVLKQVTGRLTSEHLELLVSGLKGKRDGRMPTEREWAALRALDILVQRECRCPPPSPLAEFLRKAPNDQSLVAVASILLANHFCVVYRMFAFSRNGWSVGWTDLLDCTNRLGRMATKALDQVNVPLICRPCPSASFPSFEVSRTRYCRWTN